MGTILQSNAVKNINSTINIHGYDLGAIGAAGGTKTIDIAPVDQQGWLQFWVDARHNNGTSAISTNRKIAFGSYSTGGVKRNEEIIPDLTTNGSTISFNTVSGVYSVTLTNNYAGAIYDTSVLIITCGVNCYSGGDSSNGVL